MRGLALAILLGSSALQSCTTKTLKISSNPTGAEATLIQANGDVKKVGTTPLELSLEQFRSSPFLLLQLAKEDRVTDYILIPSPAKLSSFDLQVRLDDLPQHRGGGSKAQIVRIDNNEEVLAQALQAQLYLTKRSFEEAQSILVTLVAKNPNSFSLWSLLGNAYYLDKKKTKALEAYEKALSIKPDAIEVRNLIEKIKRE